MVMLMGLVKLKENKECGCLGELYQATTLIFFPNTNLIGVGMVSFGQSEFFSDFGIV